MEPTTIPTSPMVPTTEELMLPVIREHVVCSPGTSGGQPRIAGSRIRVKDIAIWHERMGQTPHQIVSEYPQLTLGDVHAALAYYHDHREAIDADIRAERLLYEQAKATQPSLLREKLERRKADATDDPIPSR